MQTISELKEENENLAYENKKMGDFIESLGLTIDEITDVVINGKQLNLEIIRKMETEISNLEIIVVAIEQNNIHEQIARLMERADNKRLALECVKMKGEVDITKVSFYLKHEKINYEDLVKILN